MDIIYVYFRKHCCLFTEENQQYKSYGYVFMNHQVMVEFVAWQNQSRELVAMKMKNEMC